MKAGPPDNSAGNCGKRRFAEPEQITAGIEGLSYDGLGTLPPARENGKASRREQAAAPTFPALRHPQVMLRPLAAKHEASGLAAGQVLAILGRQVDFSHGSCHHERPPDQAAGRNDQLGSRARRYASGSEFIRERVREWEQRQIEQDLAALEHAHASACERNATPEEEGLILEAQREARAVTRAGRGKGKR